MSAEVDLCYKANPYNKYDQEIEDIATELGGVWESSGCGVADGWGSRDMQFVFVVLPPDDPRGYQSADERAMTFINRVRLIDGIDLEYI
jgi:hypothetical protein